MEEIRLFNQRISITPAKYHLKNFFLQNSVDTKQQFHDEHLQLVANYMIIAHSLKEYPVWLAKFQSEAINQFAFSNILVSFPNTNTVVIPQMIFK